MSKKLRDGFPLKVFAKIYDGGVDERYPEFFDEDLSDALINFQTTKVATYKLVSIRRVRRVSRIVVVKDRRK